MSGIFIPSLVKETLRYCGTPASWRARIVAIHHYMEVQVKDSVIRRESSSAEWSLALGRMFKRVNQGK